MQTIPLVKIVRRPKKDMSTQDTAVPMINIELSTMLREKERPVLTPACCKNWTPCPTKDWPLRIYSSQPFWSLLSCDRTYLHSESHHGDLGSPSIRTSETLDITGTLGYLSLHLGGVNHVCDRVIDFGIGEKSRVGKTSDSCLGIVESTLSDHPPRRWGTEVTDGEERW